jgi:hypothetical protein
MRRMQEFIVLHQPPIISGTKNILAIYVALGFEC